jgi:hypothetical protein
MQHRPIVLTSLVALAVGFTLPAEAATILYQENFDAGDSALRWISYQSHGDAAVDYAYDYGTDLGIPAAPNSVAGSTTGMRFLVNQSAGVMQGISASPLDQHFTGDFIIRFDLWINFVGPFPAGGNGSTQMASFGWGTTGGGPEPSLVQWAGGKHSIVFAASGDGGTTQDYRGYVRAYESSAGATLSPDTGYYAAGTGTTMAADSRNANDPYYAQFGSKVAPEAQVTKFAAAEFPSNQTGTTAPGTLGMAWHDVVIEKSGELITWKVDDLLMMSVPLVREDGTPANLSGDNVFFGMFDINNASSNDPNDHLNAAIFDNIVVSVPEPGSLTLVGAVALTGMLARRRRS